MVSEELLATTTLAVVTLSLPLYLHGVWTILRVEVVTWGVLVRHLRSIGLALALTALPVVGWMVPSLLTGRFTSVVGVHVFLALQSYAFLALGLWGIVPIYRAKRRRNLYHEPDPDVDLTDLDERMPQFRRRLRLGVFGHLALWVLAYLVGLLLYAQFHLPS
ncbi:MAG: hypothetical protein ACLFMX_03160 [Halobacteriales archaeon]